MPRGVNCGHPFPTRAGSRSAVMTEKRRILVFCASSTACEPHFHAAAETLGRSIAQAGHTLVYGGGAKGSMGAVADGALSEGGEVVAFVDIDPRKIGNIVHGVPVLGPDELDDASYKGEVLLAAVGSRGARDLIREQATSFGWQEGEAFWCVA